MRRTANEWRRAKKQIVVSRRRWRDRVAGGLLILAGVLAGLYLLIHATRDGAAVESRSRSIPADVRVPPSAGRAGNSGPSGPARPQRASTEPAPAERPDDPGSALADAPDRVDALLSMLCPEQERLRARAAVASGRRQMKALQTVRDACAAQQNRVLADAGPKAGEQK
jgi:hypothetical protein